MFTDSLIPSSTYFLPLLKRMTALEGPIRVELDLANSTDELIEVKAPDGVTAKLGVPRERYRVFYELRGFRTEASLVTWEDLSPYEEAALVECIKEKLAFEGWDLAVKIKNSDGTILRAVAYGTPLPKPEDKPELYLWLELWCANQDRAADRRRAAGLRSDALAQMDAKRAEQRRREEEAAAARKAAQKDAQTLSAELTDEERAARDADLLEAVWADMDETERKEVGDPAALNAEERQDLIDGHLNNRVDEYGSGDGPQAA